MEELLTHLREMIVELADTREQLLELEKIYLAFEKVQNKAAEERRELRQQLEKEVARGVRERLLTAEQDFVGMLVVKAWRKALIVNCLEDTDEEKHLVFKLKQLGWIEGELVEAPR